MPPILRLLFAVVMTSLVSACATSGEPASASCESQCQITKKELLLALGAKPDYPVEARWLGQEGRVIIRVLVGSDGAFSKASVKKSCGYALLDQAALEAVSKMKTVRKGEAKPRWYLVPITFSLRK